MQGSLATFLCCWVYYFFQALNKFGKITRLPHHSNHFLLKFLLKAHVTDALLDIVSSVQTHSKSSQKTSKKIQFRFNFPRPPSQCTFVALKSVLTGNLSQSGQKATCNSESNNECIYFNTDTGISMEREQIIFAAVKQAAIDESQVWRICWAHLKWPLGGFRSYVLLCWKKG